MSDTSFRILVIWLVMIAFYIGFCVHDFGQDTIIAELAAHITELERSR